MSDNRSAALAGALQLAQANGSPATAVEVLQNARALLSFLDGQEAKPAAAVKPAATTKPTKPAAGGKKPSKSEDEVIAAALEAQREADETADAETEADETAEETAEEPAEEFPPTKEGVQAIIAKLLQANKRKQAISLLKKFNAASATSVKEKDFVKFVAAAKAELSKSAEPSEEDLTA